MKYFWRIEPLPNCVSHPINAAYFKNQYDSNIIDVIEGKSFHNLEEVYKWILEVEGY